MTVAILLLITTVEYYFDKKDNNPTVHFIVVYHYYSYYYYYYYNYSCNVDQIDYQLDHPRAGRGESEFADSCLFLCQCCFQTFWCQVSTVNNPLVFGV